MTKSTPFTHLHTHSHYSLLNAIPKIHELVAAAKDDKQTMLAITEDGNMYSIIEFYKECKKNDIKPILGVDLFVAPRKMTDKEHRTDDAYTRLILLAETKQGYQNMIQIVTKSNLEGMHNGVSRVDLDLLGKFTDGLVAILPAHNSSVSQALDNADSRVAKKRALQYQELYKEKLYLEITSHNELLGHEDKIIKIKEIAEELKIEMLAAHDVYYLQHKDKVARALADKIHTAKRLNDEDIEHEEDYSFKTTEEMGTFFKDCPTLLENTHKVAEMCSNVDLNLGNWKFPNFPKIDGKSYDEMLRDDTYAGLERRSITLDDTMRERIEYELGIIKDKGYSPYFLVVSDLMRWADKANILTNTRGSAAGSFVSYLLDIISINPLLYNLPFERFLNPERPSPPDIDMDIPNNKRDDMINYAREKYGFNAVAQIGTFGTMASRAVVRDVNRALGGPYSLGDKIAKLIPFGKQGFPMTIDTALDIEPELAKAYKEMHEVREVIDYAKQLEGNARHVGVHAAGVVISDTGDVTDYIPVQYDPKAAQGHEKLITQYDMHGVEDAGLLKFDFLGLKNLAILADAIARVKKIQNKEIYINNLPLDDKKTYKMLAAGHTVGVFQMASTGMTKWLVDLKPTSVHDINAMVALYRPGPMEFIPEYIARKQDPSRVKYIDTRLEKYLAPTFGILIYQDDVMLIAVELAGYSWGEADKFRKAMGKKIPEEMAKQKDKFHNGCVERGMKDSVAKELWDMIETFAAYGFNKCLAGDVQIIHSKTGKPSTIKDLYASNQPFIVSSLDNNLKIVNKKVHAVVENGIKDLYLITTRSGRTIKTTDNHPMRIFSGWKNTKDLTIGERIAVTRTLLEPTKTSTIDDYKMATLGYLLAEGNLCHPHGIYYYSSSKQEVSDFIKNAKKFFNASITIDTRKLTTAVYIGQKNQKQDNILSNWLKELKLRNKKATEKHIPNTVFTHSNASLAILIGKMWQGDGCIDIKNAQLFYATSSKRLAGDIQTLLLRFAIISTLHTKKFNYRGGKKTGYTINIHGRENIVAFTKTIGKHLISKKREKLEILYKEASTSLKTIRYQRRGTKDTLPVDIFTLIRTEMNMQKISAKELSRKTNLSERIFYKNIKKKGYQRAVVQRIGEVLKSQEILSHAQSDIFWDEIISIVKQAPEMTYDLTVPSNHNFIANNFIVHNSHAVSYGALAYKTAYMKANYPLEYMSSLLTADSGDTEKIFEIVEECKKMDIEVLSPNINDSLGVFSVVLDDAGKHNNQIRFGLNSIKNFGEGISEAIVKERKSNGKYKDLTDFLIRIEDKNLNKRSIDALIKCGALDEFAERGSLLANLDTILQYHREEHNKPIDQNSLFDMNDTTSTTTIELKDAPDMQLEEKLGYEKDLLGLYISGHPLDAHKEKLEGKQDITTTKNSLNAGVTTVVAGLIEDIHTIITKKGDKMAFVRIGDYNDTLEVVVFPTIYTDYQERLVVDKCVLIKGKMSSRDGEKSFMAEAIKPL